MQTKKTVKLDKELTLINSAISLFKEKGIANTTVLDITKKSGVAKGTFYLYFNDKDELVSKVIILEASNILENALENAKKLNTNDLSEKFIFIANEIIDVFINNKQNINIIRKNLYKGLFSKDDCNKSLFSKAVDEFIKNSNSLDIEKSQKRLYILTEMIGGVCYNSISNNMPYSIYEIKDELFDCIRSIVNS